ncbi:MAG: ATP-binding protein [Pseudomonadota bacterium]
MVEYFPVSKDGLAAAIAWLDGSLGDLGLTDDARKRAIVVLDELCGNMIRHDPTLGPDNQFQLTLQELEEGVVLELRDPGMPFDPTTFRHAEQPDLGGHGIEVVRQMTAGFAYRRLGVENVVTVQLPTVAST